METLTSVSLELGPCGRCFIKALAVILMCTQHSELTRSMKSVGEDRDRGSITQYTAAVVFGVLHRRSSVNLSSLVDLNSRPVKSESLVVGPLAFFFLKSSSDDSVK